MSSTDRWMLLGAGVLGAAVCVHFARTQGNALGVHPLAIAAAVAAVGYVYREVAS